MKRLMKLYESCKLPIRVTYFAFALIAFGFLIQNRNVNLFYTFRSSIVLFIAELLLKTGEFIVMNLPLIYMLNIVCKKANSASPVIMALVGYFTYAVTTMMFSPQNLNPLAYSSTYGINSVLNVSSGTRYAIETGLIGSLLVAYATRVSFIFSRHRGVYSLANILAKDTAGLIYNIMICFLLGVASAYAFPIFYAYVQRAIVFISEDLLDPFRLGFYTVIERVSSILGIGNIIRYPFWFTSFGGSYSNSLTGQSVLGDVNIWTYIQDNDVSYYGAGRFITPYYVINMFMIPAFYIGTLLSMSDRNDRQGMILPVIFGTMLSIIAGNPLPAEMVMLFTSPGLLMIYLLMTGLVSGVLVNYGAFLGFASSSVNTAVAMPGSFADFIINVRNINLIPALRMILLVGLVAFMLFFFATLAYYRYFAFDFPVTGRGEEFVDKIIAASGGLDNIARSGSGLFRLKVDIINPEKIAVEKVRDLDDVVISETRRGLLLDLGTSSAIIAHRINRRLAKRH